MDTPAPQKNSCIPIAFFPKYGIMNSTQIFI